MKRIKNVCKIVEEILREFPSTRANDSELYAFVCRRMNPAVEGMSFVYVLMNANDLGLPKAESVRRSRQRLQELYPISLSPSESVIAGRMESKKEVEKFVRSKI